MFPPPPPLLNPGAVAAAGPDVADSLRRLQDKAVTNTLADHGLPESDRDAVLSWGRDDAEAELWALIVEAIDTSEAPAHRRPAARGGMDDAAGLGAGQRRRGAGRPEYATWAGLDVKDYWRKARNATVDS